MKKVISFITLFSSASTLICCAIPALLVSIGLGASFASFISQYPDLIWFSEHKAELFIFSGVMLSVTTFFRLRVQLIACPIDPTLKNACADTKKISGYILMLSVALYGIGIFFAYIAPRLLG